MEHEGPGATRSVFDHFGQFEGEQHGFEPDQQDGGIFRAGPQVQGRDVGANKRFHCLAPPTYPSGEEPAPASAPAKYPPGTLILRL